MISINGKIFSGNNVTILEGRISNGFGTGKTQKFDEIKSENANNVEKITIDSTFIDVSISDSNSSKIEAHFYGQAYVDGNIDFDVQLINHELKITLRLTGSCSSANLKLDITVPCKIFKAISVKSSSSNISLSKNVSTNYLKLETKSGNLKTNATFTNASLTTISGNVELCTNANKDIVVGISTMSGNVINCHAERTGYTVDGNISALSGNIKII